MIGIYTRSPFKGGVSPSQGPSAAFSISGSNLTHQFTDLSTPGDASIISWSWNFGDGNSSNLQNPSHTYVSSGTYDVSLTIIDASNNSSVVSQSLIANTPPLPEFDEMSDRIANLGRSRTSGQGNSRYYGAVLADTENSPLEVAGTIQEIIDSQDTDGRFAILGPVPDLAETSIETMTYWHNQIQRCLKKIAMAYRFGDYDPSFQNSAIARTAIWRSFAWLVNNVDSYAFGDRRDWTPKGWWGLYIIADVLHMMAPAYLSFNSETANGETVASIMRRLFGKVAGMDNDFNRLGGAVSWDEENLTGSADNNQGANGLSRAVAAFWLAVFVARVTGATEGSAKTEWMITTRENATSKLQIGYGLTYYESPDGSLAEWQDYVGIHPEGRFAAHNSPGAHAHAERYGYTLLSNLVAFLQVTQNTSWAFPSTDFDNIMILTETIVNNKIRNNNSKRTQGRRISSNPPSASISSIIVNLINYGTFAPDQVVRLQELERLGRMASLVPSVSHVKWFGTVGILEIVGGGRNDSGQPTTEYGFYSHFARARQGDVVAGVACREVQNENAVHLSNGDAIVLSGTNLNESNTDKNFGQFRLYTRGNNSPLIHTPQAVHGVVLMDDPTITTQSSTVQASARNDLHSGVADGSRFGVAGNRYHRADDVATFSYFKTRYMQSKVAFTDIQHPQLSPFMAAIFELASDIQTVNGPITEIIAHNVVYTWDRPIVYNFGTLATAHPGTSLSQSFTSVSFGWIWQAVDSDLSNYPYGRGTLFIGNKNLVMDCEGLKFRVMIDLTTNPAGTSSEFLTVLRCTQADMEELAANFANYFSFVNTPDLQGATLRNESVSAFNCWTPNIPFIMEDGNSITIDEAGSIIVQPEGLGYHVRGAWGRWRDVQTTPIQGTNISISSFATPIFLEWGKMNLTVDRTGPGQDKPPGEYYGPFGNEVAIS